MSEEKTEDLEKFKNSSSVDSVQQYSNSENENNLENVEGVDEYEYEEWKSEESDDDAEPRDLKRTRSRKDVRSFGRRESFKEVDARPSMPRFSHGLDEHELEEFKTQELARFSQSLGISGIARVKLSPLTQKILGCVIDENVTTEYPWISVDKEIIEDNLILHSESSDFLPVKNSLNEYKEQQILLGYAPTLLDNNDFYVCITKESRDSVLKHIEELRVQQQQRVLGAVQKLPKEWKHLGSEQDIKESFVTKSRPLYEIQIEATIDELKSQNKIANKMSSDGRNDNVEVVPYRESFSNVTRALIHKASEELPAKKENQAQTEAAMSVNAICQCTLDKEPMVESDQVNIKELEKFVKNRSEEICEQVLVNSTWDMYKNDYLRLVPDSVESLPMKPEGYVERQNFYNGEMSNDRVINDLSWHPEWTGVMIAAYTTISNNQVLNAPKQLEKPTGDVHQVFIWSFDDCLKPKLVLRSVREVRAVSFCHINGNIVIGGCCNGQILIWDITGKIEDVEKVIVRTESEVKIDTLIKSLTTWMKELPSSSIISPTAASSFQFSQKRPITAIKWLSPYHKIDDRGIVHDLPEDTAEEDLGLQFLSSSEDGTIAFWDLKWKPPEDPKKEKEKLKKKKNLPESLTQSISPFKILDGIYKPIYLLIVQNYQETRNAIIMTVNYHDETLEKEQVHEPFDDITTRNYYKVIMKKKKQPITGRMFIGTARGECGVVSWEGFDFSTGQPLNREICKWEWINSIHDGPVYFSIRSPFLQDIILTVGGKTFAVWREDFVEPILWRTTDTIYRYTACCWDINKPTAFILGRSDGTVETWDMFIKSHEPNIVESLSGRIITGIYAHELPLKSTCVAFCDYNGALRIFLAPKVLVESVENYAKWMRQFVDREVDRNRNFLEWKKKNLDQSDDEEAKKKAKKLQADVEAKEKMLEEEAKIQAARTAKKKERKTLIDKLQARWVTRELERMQEVILERKGLKKEELERRREPILKMKQEARIKEEKRQHVIETADEVFQDIVEANFPYFSEKSAASDKNLADRRATEQELAAGDQLSVDEKIIEDYKKIEAEAMAYIKKVSSYDLDFNWQKLICEGGNRRKSMDVNLITQNIRRNSSIADRDHDMRSDSLNSNESLKRQGKEVTDA